MLLASASPSPSALPMRTLLQAHTHVPTATLFERQSSPIPGVFVRRRGPRLTSLKINNLQLFRRNIWLIFPFHVLRSELTHFFFYESTLKVSSENEKHFLYFQKFIVCESLEEFGNNNENKER